MRKKLGIPISYAGPSRITGFTKIKLSGTDNLFAASYRWNLVSKPKNSMAMLNNTKVEQPTLIADVIGDYVVELTVDDNTAGDEKEKSSPTTSPTTVTITVSNEVTFHPTAKGASIH